MWVARWNSRYTDYVHKGFGGIQKRNARPELKNYPDSIYGKSGGNSSIQPADSGKGIHG